MSSNSWGKSEAFLRSLGSIGEVSFWGGESVFNSLLHPAGEVEPGVPETNLAAMGSEAALRCDKRALAHRPMYQLSNNVLGSRDDRMMLNSVPRRTVS